MRLEDCKVGIVVRYIMTERISNNCLKDLFGHVGTILRIRNYGEFPLTIRFDDREYPHISPSEIEIYHTEPDQEGNYW